MRKNTIVFSHDIALVVNDEASPNANRPRNRVADSRPEARQLPKGNTGGAA